MKEEEKGNKYGSLILLNKSCETNKNKVHPPQDKEDNEFGWGLDNLCCTVHNKIEVVPIDH